MCDSNDSLLARVYGIYQVKLEDQTPVTLVVMSNCFSGLGKDPDILGVFDLKGSQTNRVVKAKDRILEGEGLKKTQTLKDLNLLQMEKELKIKFSEGDRAKILKSLSEDVSLLTKFNLMDYSLLLCVQKI